MSAAVKRVVKQLGNKEFRQYLATTHFWGPFLNWGIPIAALLDIQKDPKIISGKMTTALLLYSLIFMRFSVVVKPRNNLLLACHIVNGSAQTIQLCRFVNHNYLRRESTAVQPL